MGLGESILDADLELESAPLRGPEKPPLIRVVRILIDTPETVDEQIEAEILNAALRSSEVRVT